MRNLAFSMLIVSLGALGCQPNVVGGSSSNGTTASSTNTTTSTTTSSSTTSSSSSNTTTSSSTTSSTSTTTGGTGSTSTTTTSSSSTSSSSTGSTGDAARATYPPPPYGVGINHVEDDYAFPGYLSLGANTVASSATYFDDSTPLDFQNIRNQINPATGVVFRYMLLDVGAVWCFYCNQEADDLGIGGNAHANVQTWLNQGGVIYSVIIEGAQQGTPPVPTDLGDWISSHQTPYSIGIDLTQQLANAGITPSALPYHAIIDLDTMKVVNSYYGADSTYSAWNAALSNP